ncbi:MAG: rod shape-determining protein MreC [Verrucomicrobiales bacterium]
MSRLNIIFLIAFVGLLVWITLFQPDTVRRVQRGALEAFEPFMKASTRVEDTVESLGTESLAPAELRSRVAELEKERNRLKLEVIQLDELLAENNELRRALQYMEKSPLSLVPARVVNRKPSTWYNTMVIDKGRLDGVAVDSPVIVPVGEDAGLVGKVSEVLGDHSAVVLLLTDEMCQVSAKLKNTQEQGIVSGQRGALRTMPNLQLRYLPKEAEIFPGQEVFSSGAGELFPPNLLLGKVVSFEVGVIDAEAAVEPGVDFEELLDVFVVLPIRAMPLDPEPPETSATPLESAP